MDIRNCNKCNEIFKFEGDEECSRCLNGGQTEFQKVRDYLYSNPGENVETVSKATGVRVPILMSFLRQERLEVRDSRNTLLECTRCGKSIKSGNHCEKCK